MSMQAKELIAGLHREGNHKAGDRFLQAFQESQLAPQLSEETMEKVKEMGDLLVLTQEQVKNSVDFLPRGIGSNSIACFCCGKSERHGVQPDMASFVHSKRDGERAMAMFEGLGSYASLDYRDSEPNWIQVKVGACKEHLPQLEKLNVLVDLNGGKLHPTLIEASQTFSPAR